MREIHSFVHYFQATVYNENHLFDLFSKRFLGESIITVIISNRESKFTA